MDDPRIDFAASTVQDILAVDAKWKHEIKEDGTVRRFLDDPETMCLRATRTMEGGVVLSNTIASKTEKTGVKGREVVLIKKGRGVVPKKGFEKLITVNSIPESPLLSLLLGIRHIYGPKFKTMQGEDSVNPKIQRLLVDLYSSLMRQVRQSSGRKGGGARETDVSGIDSLHDELDYWKGIAERQGVEPAAKDRAQAFAGHLKAVASHFKSAANLKFSELYRLLGDAKDALDGLWQEQDFDSGARYPRERMMHLLELVGVAVAKNIRMKLGSVSLWESPFPVLQPLLRDAIRLCKLWVDESKELTTIEWKARWNKDGRGRPYNDEVLMCLGRRLRSVLDVRSLQQELLRLIPRNKAVKLAGPSLSETVKPFRNIDVLYSGPLLDEMWGLALEEFNRLCIPLEREAVTALRERIKRLSSKPQLLLAEFRNFAKLMKRPSMKNLLRLERETLLGQLLAHLENLRHQFDSGFSESSYKPEESGHNLSEKINKVIWASQLEQRCRQATTIVKVILSDVNGYQKFIGESAELLNGLRDFKKELFEDWCNENLDSLRDHKSPLRLETSGQLMELDVMGSGLLKVHFSERLVTLLREVRQFSEFGYKIPKEIISAVEKGQSYYRYGLKLKQVANFYNTIGEQIIPSQMGMLAVEAHKFERVVTRTDVRWDNPDSCERYMQQLMEAGQELTSRNRRLRAKHQRLAEDVVELMNTDLWSKMDHWMRKIAEMKKVFSKEEKRNEEASILAWKAHWDMQLYKALELQYRMCLQTLNEKVREIPVSLYFSAGALKFKPPLEELRLRYFRNIKTLIDLPKTFTGFGGAEGIYAKIPEKNAKGLFLVHANAERLFINLRKLREGLLSWVALGTVNLEDFVMERLHTVEDWERNLKALIRKRHDAERLPESKRVGCFNVSFSALKLTIEDHMDRLNDALLVSLKRVAQKEYKVVEEFLETSLTGLASLPRTVKDMRSSQEKWSAIDSKKGGVEKILGECERKNRLLRRMAAAPLAVADLRSKWNDQFIAALEQFDKSMIDQKEQLKHQVEERIKECKIKADGFFAKWKGLKPKAEGKVSPERAEKILSEIADWEDEYKAMEAESKEIVLDANSFEMEEPTFEVLEDIRKDILSYRKAWGMYEEYSKGLTKMTDEQWISFRGKLYMFDEFREQWQKRIKGKPLDVVTSSIRDQLSMIQDVFPLLRRVTGEIFENEHWKILFTKLGFKGMTLTKLTLGHFLDAKDRMVKQSRELAALAARAQGEVQIREGVQELKVFAEETDFDLLEYKTTNRTTYLIKEWKDLFTKLGDKRSLLASLKESPHFPPFADQVEGIETRLSLLDMVLRDLNIVQRKWVYLEPIFSRGALPQEQGRFRRIDSSFLELLGEIKSNPNVMNLAMVPGLEDTVSMLLGQLEQCSKALNNFLETKRSKFPRFYFIGDDDLLEILGQAQNPAVILTHLRKLFAGIHACKFNEAKTKITTICSSSGEEVPLLEPVVVTEEVESWLQELSEAMVSTLSQLLRDCVNSQQIHYDKFPAQILCVAEMVIFTLECERAMQNGNLKEYHEILKKKLAQLTGIETKQNKQLRSKIKVMVFDLIHNIEVVEQLIQARCTSTSHWMWQKQLRYYLRPDDGNCHVKMCGSDFNYSYEYHGNAAKLVHTPLTDKCYLVLTQGMHLGYGGNPYGPAGTGKTESVKALGNCLGRQTLVFNCDEAIDFRSMARIFRGLVKSGAWGCFDEFNRLKEDQLSAVSQQIQSIQAALKHGEPMAEILGTSVEVNRNAAIFVTMNPASKEYGGRSKLPHNLKQLFRAVAMSKPNMKLIGEVMLYAEGFEHARDLGHKLIEVYQLSKQLLSRQKHYDWGLRALKTVLRYGGALIQKERRAGRTVDWNVEAKLLVGAACINTLSKLTYTDGVRFNQLVQDVFSGLKVEEVVNLDLKKAIVQSLQELKLEINDSQIRKALQLHAALNQRMGCVVVGPSGCGKSVMWRVLKHALGKMGRKIVTHVMNPKAMDRTKLLGEMDPDTREWQDGVLTASARQVMKEPPEHHSWILCDGDIDPVWVESLNSVLDDNKLLTMPNGERIQFGSNVNFIFESHDLQFASPATISRMGMILLSEEDVDIKGLVASWISRQQPKEIRAKLTEWMDAIFYSALEWVLKMDCQVVKTSKVGLVTSCFSQLEGGEIKTRVEFVLGVIRGLGSNMQLKERKEFAKRIYALGSIQPPDPRNILNCYYDRKTSRLACYAQENASITFDDISVTEPPVIKTVDIQTNLDIIRPWLRALRPFIVVGPEGAGKTMLLRHAFSEIKAANIATINCSSQTDSKNVIGKLFECCSMFNTNSGRVLRPKDGERLILYLRNLNLPKPDQYNTSELISFLQQLITYNGFYDDSLDWIGIEKVQVVGSMNPSTTVGRNKLSSRFTSIVNICYIDYPAQDQLKAIYTNYLAAAIKYNRTEVRDMVQGGTWSKPQAHQQLAATSVDIYQKLRRKFNTSEQRHYLFCPRDLTRWIFNLMRYDLSAQSLLDVWAYEAHRLFADRLVEEANKQKFKGLVHSTLRNKWKYEVKIDGMCFASFVASEAAEPVNSGGGDDKKSQNALGVPKELGKEMTRVSVEDFKELVRDAIRTYERDYKMLNLILFPQVLDILAFEDRVLSQPGGSLLLVGRSGVGRRSTITVVAHIHHLEVFSPRMSRGYTMKQFKADMQNVVRKAGVENTKILLYLEDFQITENVMLEAVNSLLASGEIPGLFSSAELDPLLAPLKDDFQRDGNYRTVYQFFVARVHRNVRLVLSFNPEHPEFASRCESNPAIFTTCTVLWLGSWSQNTMRQVPQLKLSSLFELLDDAEVNVDQKAASSAGQQDGVVKLIEVICKGSTPLEFIAFLNTYETILRSKRAVKLEETKRLKAGLDKLVEASEKVDIMSREATVKRQLLTKKNAEADDQLKTISQRMALSATRKQETDTLEKALKVEEEKLTGERTKIEAELKEIQPLIDEAKKAVNGINKRNLNEIRALRIPPNAIQDVISAVLYILGEFDTSWNNMKKFLGSPHVKTSIMEFDARNITPEIRAKVRDLIRKSGDSFEPARIQRVNQACAPMASWVKANLTYSEVLDNVKPLEAKQAAATQKLKAAESRLARCKQEKQDLEDEVKRLNQTFKKTTEEAQVLKIELNKTETILNSAQSLIGKLSGEKSRWQGQVKQLSADLSEVPFNALLAAGFITYLGGEAESEREEELSKWMKLANIRKFDLIKFMSSESEMLKFKADGLPGDLLSMQNALIIRNTSQTPFIIDPNTQATKWLQKELKKNSSVEVVMQQEARFVNALELAVRFGKTLVVLEVDAIEPILVPVIRKDLTRQGPRWVVQVGDKILDYNENFRLFLATRSATAHLSPDMSALITECNFTITRSGLEGQLLGITLSREMPELETRKSALLKEEEDMKIQIAQLEESLLSELANSEGDILENKALISSLNKTKKQAIVIAEALQKSKQVGEDLDNKRNIYRPIARAGSRLYFTIAQLHAVNHMYRYSLSAFLDIFRVNLAAQREKAGDSKDAVKQRIRGLCRSLVVRIFDYVVLSLFKEDRLMFGMHLTHCMFHKRFAGEEWEFFTGQSVQLEAKGQLPEWMSQSLPASTCARFQALQASFPSLVATLNIDNTEWASFMKAPRCETVQDFPKTIKGGPGHISAFQRLLVVQALRPDRVIEAMKIFCCGLIGKEYLAPPPTNMEDLNTRASKTTPILFMTSAGADPSRDIEEFAVSQVGKDKFKQLAMGSGQGEVAVKLVTEAARTGGMVLLKNLHLVTTWLPHLEKLVKSLSQSAQPSFRIWLTTETHSNFPPILLEQSLKISFEAPPGIKENLLRTYSNWSPAYIAKGGKLRAKLLFILAWFHAIVQERRTYVPQGWTKFYEFSNADLRSGSDIIDEIVADNATPESVPWETLLGLFKTAIYGGRIDSKHDLKILDTYLNRYFNKNQVSSPPRASLAPGCRVIPDSKSHRDYVEFIKSLSANDNPAMFGLPNNIDEGLVVQKRTRQVAVQLRKLAVSTSLSSNFNKALWRNQLKGVFKVWDTAKQNPLLSQKPPIMDEKVLTMNPVDGFVYGEMGRTWKLISILSHSLGGLDSVLYKTGSLTPQIEKDGEDLLKGKVPWAWAKNWWGPEEPKAWIREVVKRKVALHSWIERIESGSLFGAPLCLADLFQIEVFFNSLRQQTAREAKVQIGKLALFCSLDRAQMPKSAILQVEITGILIQGRSPDKDKMNNKFEFVRNGNVSVDMPEIKNGQLVPVPNANRPSLTTMPNCIVSWVDKEELQKGNFSNNVALPMYFMGSREDFICELGVPCDPKYHEVCVLGGTALFISSM